jgi:osmotically inducible protein OsmC
MLNISEESAGNDAVPANSLILAFHQNHYPMATRTAKAEWEGTLNNGKGTMNFSNYSGPFTFASRFEEGDGTNPEELVGAAHAGCYSMFLSALISGDNLTPETIRTTATVHLTRDDTGPVISNIELDCEVKCEGLSQERFDELANAAKEKCPVSRLYSSAEIKLNAVLS